MACACSLAPAENSTVQRLAPAPCSATTGLAAVQSVEQARPPSGQSPRRPASQKLYSSSWWQDS